MSEGDTLGSNGWQVLRVAEMRNGKAMRHVALKIIIPRAGSKLEEVERRFNRSLTCPCVLKIHIPTL